MVLEFSKPRKFPMKQLYGFHSKVIIPFFGRMFSKDKAAYTYLPESIKAFPEGQHFVDILNEVGYADTALRPLTGGIATIYTAAK